METNTMLGDNTTETVITVEVPDKELVGELTDQVLNEALVEMRNEIVRTVYKEFYKVKSSSKKKELYKEYQALIKGSEIETTDKSETAEKAVSEIQSDTTNKREVF